MYKGDVSPKAAMARLKANPSAVLLDVRLAEELEDVGMPDVERFANVEWITMPYGDINPNFIQEVKELGIGKDSEILVICKVGERSVDAAIALTAAGFTDAYNVLDGFEGEADGDGYRGTVSGWLFEKLAWREQKEVCKVA